ncbi:uncharacterized protein LOC143287907 [Babylonia areolata]|uniref:uncharacterized protein LOC143287907 n=1 Tax=Babylonia areolata TaxID=304850 RepID=UPI003FD25E30
MVMKRRDFQKAAAFIHEFLLKMSEDVECAELRDTLNLALLHMQKYYKLLQSKSQEKNAHNTLTLSARGLSPMTPFVDAPDKFRWRWINLDNARLPSNMSVTESINLTTLPPMIQAVKAGNIRIMQELAQQDSAIVDDADGIGRTGLMYAVHHTEYHALNFLLESQADVNVAAHDGATALHYACHEGNAAALNLLLRHGAYIGLMDTQGRAPIHWAVTTPSTQCLQMLLENGADPAQRDKDGLTPCMWACRMDHIAHFDLLSRTNYSIAEHDAIERDGNGRTWMHWAVRRTEPLECLQTLLTAESAGYKDEEGKTVLMLAAEIGSLPATRLILEIAGTDTLDDYDSQSRTALHLAVIGGHGDVVNFLLEQGADINQPDRYNATAWDYARSRQLHYCQLIIMSHQRQRMMSNPTSPLPNGLGLLLHSDTAMPDNFSRMVGSVRTRSDHSTPITPPHPPKRPRTSRMLQRRANSLTTPDRDQEMQEQVTAPARLTSSAGPDRKKERIEVTVNTRLATNNKAFMPASRQDSTVTDEDMMNVMNDVEINAEEEEEEEEEEDIDNVSVGGMDVSDIEDTEQQHNGHASNDHGPQRGEETGRARPQPAHRPALSRPQQLPRRQPRPPGGAGFRSVPPPHPPPSAPSYTRPLDPSGSQDKEGAVISGSPPNPPSAPLAQQPFAHQPLTTTTTTTSKPSPQSSSSSLSSYAPQAPPPRPALRSSHQQLRLSPGRGPVPVPSPPNMDPQKPHMIRHQAPLPPQPAYRDPPAQQAPSPNGAEIGGHGEQAVSPQPSSQSSDQVSTRTQINVAVGPTGAGGGGGGGFDANRPSSGGNASKNPGVSIEGRRIPPPMLTPLPNAPKPPLHDLFTPSMDPLPERKKKKKKKNRLAAAAAAGAGNQEKESEGRSPPQGKSPPQNPLEIPPPRGFAAPLHPGRERGHSAALHGPKVSRGQPQHSETRFVDENTQDDDTPPVINGFAMPIREGTMRSARPGQRTQPMPMEVGEEEVMGPAGDATNHHHHHHHHHADGVRESITEEDELGGTGVIPPPQAFRGSGGGHHPLSQSVPQDRTTLRMAPTSAKPPLPRSSNRSSASYLRRSSDKNPSPARRSRPPTSKAN